MTKHRQFCGRAIPRERYLISQAGGVRHAAVLVEPLEGVLRPSEGAGPDAPAVLDNHRCRFVPRVQVVPLGSVVEIRNSDPILHTAHAYLGQETLFNVALPHYRQNLRARLTRPGLVRVRCDVGHTWMRAYLWVVAGVAGAVSDEEGRFAVNGLAPGRYRVRVWHEALGTQTHEVRVEPGTVSMLEVWYERASRKRGGPAEGRDPRPGAGEAQGGGAR
ncbi:MAG: carboxypeptidase regulatory-like domain-containing protein [Deltaproteobacteria bacterium]|nr:carboxypeptidase regulatory-like domain-containing protein [Deltaproteobacteria bacterium]MBI3076847.1 carboxypeptidase regulatory-like domain-containing protein [Deltaproteobacteria bacterium]